MTHTVLLLYAALTTASIMFPWPPKKKLSGPTLETNTAKRHKLPVDADNKYAPFLFILDPNCDETVAVTNGPLTREFKQALESQSYAIIVNSTIVLKHLHNHHKFAHKNAWNLWAIPNTNFLIFAPKKHEAINRVLQKKELSQKNNLLKRSTTNFRKWIEKNRDSNSKLSNAIVLKIFQREKDAVILPKLTLAFSGHGNIDISAGIPSKKLPELLTLIDTQLNTYMVCISSCAAGASVIKALETSPPSGLIATDFNYPLLVASIDDSAVFSQHNFFDRFFRLSSKISLEKLCTQLNNFDTTRSRQGATDIVQLLYPHAKAFRVPQQDKRLSVITHVKKKAYEREQKTVSLCGKHALLVYPQSLNVPLAIKPYALSQDQFEQATTSTNWGNIPLAYELYCTLTAEQSDQIRAQRALFPGLEAAKQKSPELITQETGGHIFPAILSLMPGNTIHYIKAITLDTPCGILHFIRDSFLEIAYRITKKTFMIDTLTGINDISVTLESARAQQCIADSYPLEAVLKATINAQTTLKQVIITTHTDADTNKLHLKLSFALNNTAWMLQIKPSATEESGISWHFKALRYGRHIKYYDAQKQLTNFASQDSLSA